MVFYFRVFCVALQLVALQLVALQLVALQLVALLVASSKNIKIQIKPMLLNFLQQETLLLHLLLV